MEERLQKIIARAGVASRRRAEQLILSGFVTVNGRTVTKLGSKADAVRDHIKVSGKLLHAPKNCVYLILHKPDGVVSTMSDPEGRPSLQGLLHRVGERVFPVGRLAYHTSGLLLLTNDGELANLLLQSHELPQTYHFKVNSPLTLAETEQVSRATGAHIRRRLGHNAPWYEATLSEARRDVLRNKLFQSGHPVEKMRRVRLGNLELGSLPPGEYRAASEGEIRKLRRAAQRGEMPAGVRPEEPRRRGRIRRRVRGGPAS